MNRLRKKCFIASVGLHALLLIVLVVSPAFRSKDDKKVAPPPVRVIDGALVAKVLAASAPAPSAPTPPAPEPVVKQETPKPPVKQPEPPKSKPTPKPQPKPEPKPAPKKTTKPAPKPKAVSKPKPKTVSQPKPKPKWKPKKTVKVANLNNLVSQSNSSAAEKERREAEKRAERERKRQMAELDSVLSSVKFSSQVKVRASGGSSRATMDYGSYVMSTYDRQWREPSQIAVNGHTASVTVTIRKDGSVASARLSKRSGVSVLDKSIQDLIDRVRRFKPFPSGMNESQQTFTIDFSVRAK